MESNWLDLFNENKPKVIQSCCSNMDLKIIDGYQCCTNCGSLDSDNPHLVYNTYNDHSTYKCSMPYFRVVYFKQKLNMINNIYDIFNWWKYWRRQKHNHRKNKKSIG